jgi:hypothetical protein
VPLSCCCSKLNSPAGKLRAEYSDGSLCAAPLLLLLLLPASPAAGAQSISCCLRNRPWRPSPCCKLALT